MLTVHCVGFTHYGSAAFTPWLLVDPVASHSERMVQTRVSRYKSFGTNNILRSPVYHPGHDRPSAVLVQLFVALFYDLGQGLLPFSFFLSLLKLWGVSLIWFTLCPTNRSTRTVEQWLQLWEQEEHLAGWGGSSESFFIDTFVNHEITALV